jgi:hypothetical protein
MADALPNQSADVVSAAALAKKRLSRLWFGPVRKLMLSAGLLLHFTCALRTPARQRRLRQLDRQASA